MALFARRASGAEATLGLEVAEGHPPVQLTLADLACEGANSSIIDWPALRANLSIYVAVNSAPEAVTLDSGSEAMLGALRSLRMLDMIANPAEECLLGSICLKIIGAAALSERMQLHDFSTLRGVTVHEAFELLRRTSDWHLLAASGWPIFALLAKLQLLLYNRFGASNVFNEYLEEAAGNAPFLLHVDESLAHFRQVSLAESALALSTPHLVPLTHAAALFSMADAARSTLPLEQALEEVPPLVQRAAELMKTYLGAKSGMPPLHLLSTRWPLFKLVDRLACPAEVELRLPASAARPRPTHALMPMRERASDVVRACRAPYCDNSFIELLLRVAPPPVQLSLLEVGANLGDCSLWAAAHFGGRLRAALGLEPLAGPAAAFRRSVERNGWQGQVRVMEAAASDRKGLDHFHLVGLAKGNPFAHASSEPHPGLRADMVPTVAVRTVTLAEVLPEWHAMQRAARCRSSASSTPRARAPPRPRHAKVLKIYTFGGLPRVLRGAPRGALRQFAAVWLAFAVDHYPSPGRALMRLGQLFSRHGLALASPDLQRDWCHIHRPGPAAVLGRLRHRVRGSGSGRVLPLVAFRRGRLACGRRPLAGSGPPQERSQAPEPEIHPGPPECLKFFGLTARQRRARREGAGYESYFLGEEIS